MWGRNHEPPRYELVSFLFLRLFGLVYLSAFVSFALIVFANRFRLLFAQLQATGTAACRD
ncbi:MAG TPA: hypothetical protein VJY34_19100 [Roseiarcus sp.]|nr:hypothetical protein [Roseiarcus sp.]